MLGGLLLAPDLIVHILAEHLMYAWWVITCTCSNSAHIDRTSDVCLVEVITCPCSNSAHIGRISDVCLVGYIDRTADICLVGYYLPLF